MLKVTSGLITAVAAVLRLVVLPLFAAWLFTWGVVGDLSESGGYDSILRIPVAQDHAEWFGLAGLVLAAGVFVDVVRWHAEKGSRPVHAAILSAGTGVAMGVALRIITAKTGGANIGGGFLVLSAPGAVVPALGVAIWWAVRAARTQRGPVRIDVHFRG